MTARRDAAAEPRPPVGDCRPGSWREENAGHIDRRRTSWVDPATLWAARNQIVSLIADPVDAERARFVAAASRDLVIDRSDSTGAVLVIGDPGEGDESQYAVLPVLEDAADGVDFGVVCSDVIYPAGAAEDYPDKFTWPYRRLAFPLWAAPGNHDWYDGLRGFLANFCDLHTDGPPRSSFPPGPRGWLAWMLWHRDDRLTPQQIEALRADLPPATRAARVPQPAPYFVVDTAHLRYVVIDTGISGRIDPAQREWLRAVSAGDPKPKVLLTGKPLYVNGALDRRTADVAAIVADPAHRYVAAIGGDTHNYQRYRIGAVTHIVTGGGGAFMHATHTIPKTDPRKLCGLTEEEFRVFPLRRDSLVRYSQVIDRRFGLGLGWLALTEDEAARYFVQYEGINTLPVDEGVDMTRTLAMRPRIVASVLAKLYAGPWFHRLGGSVVLDWDRPRVFKQFLRLEPSADALVVRCLSASGCAGFEHVESEEDRVVIALR